MMSGALILPPTVSGITEAAAARPEYPQLAIHDRRGITLGARLTGPERVMDAYAGHPATSRTAATGAMVS